jgi:hypothetical protein
MITNLTPKQLRQAASLKERIAALQKKLARLVGGQIPAPAKAGRKKRRMSAAGRARIAAAARARWAKVRAAKKK